MILPETTTDRPFDFLQVLTWIDFSHVAKVSDAPDELAASPDGRPGRADSGWRRCGRPSAPTAGSTHSGKRTPRSSSAAAARDDPESPIGQLVRKVREHPFVMVVGRSGSGKSSLVYAGLLPALRRERDRFWNVLSLRPGPTPLRALAAAFNPRAEDEGAAEYATKITNEADKAEDR